jgi:hypothetical protein
MGRSMSKAAIYKLFYSRWRDAAAGNRASVRRQPGYTVLLPVPGDLPVFLRIAMEVIGAQEGRDRVETLVIADQTTPEFERTFATYRRDWKGGPIRLVGLPPVSRFLRAAQGNGNLNHWLQLVAGIQETHSTHALLHDADLFISDPAFVDSHYRAALEKHLACLGVNEVWDGWFKANGLGHIAATWELMFDVEWARTFKPWQHRGHDATLNGTVHVCDTMLLPQCLTPADKIARHEGNWGLIHFNNVICTYRWFHRNPGPFEDQDFRLLLIRLLIDAWDDSGWKYNLPLASEMARGRRDASNRVTYRSAEAQANFPIFRTKLQQLIDLGTLDRAIVGSLKEGVQEFDERFQWSAVPAAMAAKT